MPPGAPSDVTVPAVPGGDTAPVAPSDGTAMVACSGDMRLLIAGDEAAGVVARVEVVPVTASTALSDASQTACEGAKASLARPPVAPVAVPEREMMEIGVDNGLACWTTAAELIAAGFGMDTFTEAGKGNCEIVTSSSAESSRLATSGCPRKSLPSRASKWARTRARAVFSLTLLSCAPISSAGLASGAFPVSSCHCVFKAAHFVRRSSASASFRCN
mmetsp:Transcript_137069/g.242277  ORF Transcript_137069/g.242277 Transcript_137069/m.242277 type:complete len:217 (-) Transcript_137069:162-812(-)